MATKSLGQLTLDLVARTGGWVQGMDKAERRSKRWRRQVEKDLRKLRGQFGKFAKTAAGAGVAAAGAFTIMAKQGLEYVDAQAKMARQIGATVDGLRGLQIAANDAGVDTETLNGAVDRMNSRLGEARRGSGQAYEALERLGLSADALANMDADQRIATIADAVTGLGLDSADTADLLRNLGIRNREMVNLLMAGGEGIREARKEVDEYGLSLSKIETDRVERANDQMGRILRSTEGVRNQMVVSLAPAIETVADEFNEAAKASRGFADTGGDIADKVVASVGFVVDSVEGLKRTFELAGSAIALFALQSQQAMMKLGESIVDQPVKSINTVIEGLNKISPIDIEPVGITQLSKDLDNELALIEGAIAEGKKDIQDILMEPMPSAVFGAALEQNQRMQEGRDAGLGDTITNEAIAAANAVADSLHNASSAADESATADEDGAEKMEAAAKAVEGLGDAADNSSKKMADAANAMGGGGSTGSNREPIGANRDTAVAGAGLMERPGVINYGGAEGARPTWSTDFAPPGYLETAAQVGGSDPWSSINAQKMASIQSTSASLIGGGAGGDRVPIQLTVAGANGETVTGEGEFESKLVDLLRGAASSTSAT